jgi:CRISPR-associated protein Cmr5
MPDPAGSIGGTRLVLKSMERAKIIMGVVKAAPDLTEKDVNFIKSLPAMIMQNGLGQTLAFLIASSRQNIASLLCNSLELGSPREALCHIVNTMEPKEYISKQHEAIQCAGWIKQFAIAFQPDSPQEKEAEGDTAS